VGVLKQVLPSCKPDNYLRGRGRPKWPKTAENI